MSLVSKCLDSLKYSDVNARGELSVEQIVCAKKIVRAFDSEKPKTNYVAVKGETQSGKTGVFFGMINIINRLHLRETLKLEGIIYITADNSKGLVKQQYNRVQRSVVKYHDDDIQPIFLKRSDFKRFKEEHASIDNYIIFIDESHYGTTQEEHLLSQFLMYYGIQYMQNINLEPHNVRIISNSATPYTELASDAAENKITVFLEPSPGYVGLTDFSDNVVLLKNNAFARNIAHKALPKLFMDIYEHLRDIEKEKGQVKCCVIRACGRNDITNIHKYADNMFDIKQFDTSNGDALNYENLWNMIDLYCLTEKGRTPGRYLLVILKDAMRMGISIREKEDHNETKNRIAVLYDYPSDKYKPDVTEQGLLGRMCGYRDEGDEEWKDVRFYLREDHYLALKNFYDSGMVDARGRLKEFKLCKRTEIEERVDDITGMVSEYDAVNQGKDLEALKKEGKLYKIAPERTNDDYYTYDATEYFMSKVGKSFGGFDKFKLSDLKTSYARYTDKFIRPFLDTKDKFYSTHDYIQKGSRRCGEDIGESEKAFVDNLKDKDKPMVISQSAYPFKNEDLGKYAWQALLDMDEMENPIHPKIYVRVKVAKMVAYKYAEGLVECGSVRTAATMMTA